MQKIVLASLFIIIYAVSTSAQAIVKFEKEYHDFGEIFEGDPASYEFEIKNTGTEPLIIADVKPSCGCTTPDWTRQPIAPGAKGIIKASYGTAGRPGVFNKSITVTSNSAEIPSKIIYIRGNVVKKPEAAYTTDQLRTSPKIVLEKAFHNFGTLEKNTKMNYKLPVKNLGRSDLKITDVSSACNCIKVNKKPEFIKSGESGTIELTYEPNNLNEVEDVVNIKTNDLTNPSAKFVFKGKSVEHLVAPSILMEGKQSNPFK